MIEEIGKPKSFCTNKYDDAVKINCDETQKLIVKSFYC